MSRSLNLTEVIARWVSNCELKFTLLKLGPSLQGIWAIRSFLEYSQWLRSEKVHNARHWCNSKMDSIRIDFYREFNNFSLGSSSEVPLESFTSLTHRFPDAISSGMFLVLTVSRRFSTAAINRIPLDAGRFFFLFYLHPGNDIPKMKILQ